eukprot:m.167351 g.167351  ORF g.167351 m.167351 type:complete len:562 (-) comp12814_c0_seq1:149-1834(-)
MRVLQATALALAAGTAIVNAAPASTATEYQASVVLDGTSFTVKQGVLDPKATAWGTFSDTLNVTGWGVLDIRTGASFTDAEQHRAAGILEGFLTAGEIYPTYLNNLAFVFGTESSIPSEVKAFMSEQEAWAKEQVKAADPTDVFWTNVGAIMSQFDGLVEGYNHAVQAGTVPAVDRFGFQLLNGMGDLFQIIPAVKKELRPKWESMSVDEITAANRKSGHCSALIKLTGSYEDLYMAHSSWFQYADTNRIFKHYNFAPNTPAGAHKVSFSSYPGYLESLDDFYMMDSGLGMVQTSLGVMNNTLLDLITPHSLLAWQRVRVASAIAKTGEEWYTTFKTHASGTYVNQYMVVDFNLFQPGEPLKAGTLWVMEEIPGLVAGGDQTLSLERGYWPSYNVPFYAETYTRLGYGSVLDQALGLATTPVTIDGLGPSYQTAVRAQLFRRDEGKVVDMTTFKEIMRYANYSDPVATAGGSVNYGAALCMRGDLGHDGQGGADGCYDTKVTSWRHGFFNQTCEAVNGPSSKASSKVSTLEPFAWRSSDSNHVGLPAVYDFDFVSIAPRAL